MGHLANQMARSFPLPVKRGEGGERRSREPGEGLFAMSRHAPHPPSLRSGTLSPLRGERERKVTFSLPRKRGREGSGT